MGAQQPSPLMTLLEEDNQRLERLLAGDVENETDDQDDGGGDTKKGSGGHGSSSSSHSAGRRSNASAAAGREPTTLLEDPQGIKSQSGSGTGGPGAGRQGGGASELVAEGEDPDEAIAQLEADVAELESVLTETARQQAKELAQLEMKVMEAELMGSADSVSLVSVATTLDNLRINTAGSHFGGVVNKNNNGDDADDADDDGSAGRRAGTAASLATVTTTTSAA